MKTCLPYSFGQVFRFKNKKKSSSSKTLLQNIGIREDAKFLVAATGESGLSFYSHLVRPQENVCGLDCKILGYPKVDQTKINKLFEGLKPDGHFDMGLSHSLVQALASSNFVSLEATKNTRPINKPTNVVIQKAPYTSAKFFNNNVRKINLLNDYTLYPAGGVHANNISVENFKWNFFDFYIPSYNFNPENAPDLVILPTGSIIWYWDKSWQRWITCAVVNTKSKKGEKIKTEFVEIENDKLKYTNVVLTIRQTTERSLTMVIQRLIQQDQIRIAISSLKGIDSSSAKYNKNEITPTILRLLKKSFNCEYLDQLKLSILDSTEYKTIQNYPDFINLLFSQKGRPLNAKYHDKTLVNNVAIYAIKAAEESAPLFWGLKETAKWVEEEESNKINKVINGSICHNCDNFLYLDLKSALQYCSTHMRVLTDFNHPYSSIPSVKVNTVVDIKKTVLLERLDTETYNVCVSTPQYIHDMGEKAVSKFVRQKINSKKNLHAINQKDEYKNPYHVDDPSVKFSQLHITEGPISLNKKRTNQTEEVEVIIKESNS